jgi:ketosteroid isomerase-like protein
MSTEEYKETAKKWIAAFNSKDLESLLSLYHDDAEHFSPKLKLAKPETNGLIKGKEALRIWWLDAFTRLPELHYRVLSFTVENDQLFIEYERQVPGEPNFRVAELLRFRGGKIGSSHVFHG